MACDGDWGSLYTAWWAVTDVAAPLLVTRVLYVLFHGN